MKKVIRGRLYDTETAKLIGSTSDTGETLYRKRTGEYFLCCIGDSGEHIQPMTYDEAKGWAEKAFKADKWAAEFGELGENGNRTTLNISITVGAADIVKRAAQKSGKSVSETIEALIRNNLI